MTKKHKQKRSKAWISWVFLLVLLIIAGVVTYMVWNYSFNDETKTENVEVVEEKTESTDSDSSGGDETSTESATEDDTNGGKKVKQFEGEDPNKAEDLTGAITHAGVTGQELVIATNIDQYLNEGTCELVISNNGATVYSETVAIKPNVSTSACDGFRIPVSVLGSGTMQIVINLSAGSKNGTLTTEANI